MILAGDIGGTKTAVALFARRRGRLEPVAQQRVKSREFRSLEELVERFLREQHASVATACFGIAGPVMGGRCEATNLAWVVDAAALQRRFKFRAVVLLNDLEALAYGIETLRPSAVAVLNAGTPQPRGTIAVIAAGTGLGEAALIWDGRRYRAVASEGGHADFAPRTELEVELWRALRRALGHVSYERVLSGPGKLAIYEFLKATGRGREPAWLARRLASGDPTAVVSEVALEGGNALCVKAIELFVSIYGAEAGNLALKLFATGGVYVGGGIAPTMLPKLRDGTFMRAFTDKGRFVSLLATIPVRVILEERAGLFGAAQYASTMTQAQ